MKNKLKLLSAICLISMVTIHAQSTDRRENLKFGVKAGINVSNIWDSQNQEFTADSKVGFAGGIFLGIPIGSFLGLQPEILISQKGFKGSGTLLGSPIQQVGPPLT